MNEKAFLFLSGMMIFSSGFVLTVYNKEVVHGWINRRKEIFGENNIKLFRENRVRWQTALGTIAMAGLGLTGMASALDCSARVFNILGIIIFSSGIASIITSWFMKKRE
jgi:hypothetical protein